MSRRLSVGTSLGDAGFIALIVLAVVAVLGGGLMMLVGTTTAGAVVLGLGVLCAAFAFVRGVILARGRRWITPTDEGFIFESNAGEFEFRDEDIVELGTWARVVYSNGLPKSITREGIFILSAGEYRGDMKYAYTYDLQQPDPLAAFLDRNLERLTAVAAEQIARGEPFIGEGWEFDAGELISTTDRTIEPCRVDRMSAAEVVDDKVCVWVRGEAKPMVQIPAGSVNALILLRYLAKKIEERGPRAEEDVPGLGRVIFERDHSTTNGVAVFCWIFGAAAALVGVGMVISGMMADKSGGPLILFGVILALLAIAIPWAIWANRVNIFRCHTRGVCKITTSGIKQLEYKDVREFSYSVVRNYTNGAYTGTTIALSFAPEKDSDLPSIDYSANVQKIDGEVDNLREHVSLVIAVNMKQRLDTGVDVPWTKDFTFTPEGLDVNIPGGIMSRAKNVLLPYSQCMMNINEGHFFLFRRGEDKQIHSIMVTEPNFFPGYMLLCRLAFPEEAQAGETAAPPAEAEAEDDDPRPSSRRERRRRDEHDNDDR